MKSHHLLLLLWAVLLISQSRAQNDDNSKKVMAEDYPKEIMEIAQRIGLEPKQVAEARTLKPAELETITKAYLKETHQSEAYWRLMPARDLAAPYLISAFEMEEPFKRNDLTGRINDSPASRALDFLEKGVHSTLKTHLLRWLSKGDKNIHLMISRHLVAFGSDDLLPHIKVLFEQEDIYLTKASMDGALEAFNSGRAQPVFRKYLWEQAVRLLNAKGSNFLNNSCELLVSMDKEATKKLLLDSKFLNKDHPLLVDILKTLNQLQSPADVNFLNALIADETLTPPHRKESIQKAALEGLIVHRHPSANKHIDRMISEPSKFNKDLVLAAWNGKFTLAGLTPILSSAPKAFEKQKSKIEHLSQDEQNIILMYSLDADIVTGGFSAWYESSDGKYSQYVLNAFQKVGAEKHASTIATANQLFGPNGPPKNIELAEKALRDMSEKNSDKLSELGELWDKLPSWKIQVAEWDWLRQNKAAK